MAVTLSRGGARNGAVANWNEQNDLFLTKFGLEALEAFDRRCIFKDMIPKRVIENGKASQFPSFGRFTAGYHTPGQQIDGQGNMAQNEVLIRVDNYLYSSCVIDDLDEARAHYDLRRIYTRQLGEALAREFDKRVARVLTIAARTSTSDLTADLPSGLSPDDPYRTGTRIDLANATPSPDDYVAAMFAAKQALEEKDIDPEGWVAVCTPEVHNTLVQSNRAIHQDFNHGDNGSYSSGTVARLAGFRIMSSNHVGQGNVTAPAGEQGFTFNGSDTILSSVNMTQTKMLLFHPSAMGVIQLRGLQMSKTGNDYFVQYNAHLFKGQYALGFGVLRPECAVEVYNSL